MSKKGRYSIEGIIKWCVVWKSERNIEGLIEWYTEAVWKEVLRNNRIIWRRKRERDIEGIIKDGEWKVSKNYWKDNRMIRRRKERKIEEIIEWYIGGKREKYLKE